MSELSFAVGQRWVSNSEAELGLGIISAIEGRRIDVLFQAAEEHRTYAADNAPLSRVMYAAGEKVLHQNGTQITITQVETLNGCLVYLGEDSHGVEHTLHEMDLTSFVQFSQPQQRLFAGQIDKNNQFDLRLKALHYEHQLQQSSLYGLMGGRVQLLPHQFYIAEQVAKRLAPRVLLADEVGLGKTIEAGLILHQQLLTGRAKRVLIIVPDSLLHQWLVEMLRRFNLSFTVIDGERHDALTELEEGNPFDSAQLVLCSLQCLLSEPAMQANLLESRWDLLVVDEAHHLHWQADQPSPEYQLIADLAQQIAGVLLLTATPQQLGLRGHFARLKLLDPQRYSAFEAFEQEQHLYSDINDLLNELLALTTADDLLNQPALQQQLAVKLSDSLLQDLLDVDQFASAQQQAKQQLLDQFGTGRLLFRNTREVIKGFPTRHLVSHALAAMQQEGVEAAAWLRPEHVLGENWLETDPRVAWLVSWLKEHRADKTLLICESAETAYDLEQYLRVRHGFRSSVFHEGMTLVNRDRAAAYFADDEAGAQLLVCSEIGSEGRNFQFCHQLICFDLPLNPDLLEQRIGRLDRIGQRHAIHIHVPFYQLTAQQRLLEWYHEGLNAFEQVQTAGGQMAEQLAPQLKAMIQQPEAAELAKRCIKETQQLNAEITASLQQGRNRLLELNSFDADKASAIIGELEATSRPIELADFMADFCDAFGVEQQVHSADSVILMPGDQMRQQDLPGLPEDGITATYQRQKALIREDMAFLTWEHPLVRGALDGVIHHEMGNSAFCFLADDRFEQGSLLLEAVFVMQTTAPAKLQLPRYFPKQLQRFVIDEQGQDQAELLTITQLSKQAGRIPKTTAQQLVMHARKRIEKLLKTAETHAGICLIPMVSSAQQQMQMHTQQEIDRLKQLAKLNPAVHPEEISQLESLQQQAEIALHSAQLRLDAIRVVIITEPS